jgi:hypothetical protein
MIESGLISKGKGSLPGSPIINKLRHEDGFPGT